MALRQVVLSWAERDPQKAKAWVLEQSSGTLHDAALAAVMLAKANAEIADRQLLVSFSSETARADAIVGAMDAFRRSDPPLGRSLIDRYLFDPARRDAAEKRLEGRAPPERIRVIGGVVIR